MICRQFLCVMGENTLIHIYLCIYMNIHMYVYISDMPFKSDEKSEKVGRTFPDF